MIKAIRKGKLLEDWIPGGIDCYVLDDEAATPVIHVGGILSAIGAHGKGGLRQYLSNIGVESLLESSPTMRVSLPDGGTAMCHPATFLIDVALAYTRLPIVRPDQVHMVTACHVVVGAFAKLGIEKTVYIQCGYQEIDAKEKSAAKLHMWISEGFTEWDRMWTRELVKALCRIYRHPYDGGRHPHFLSSVYSKAYRIVCGRDIYKEMRRRNPHPHMRSNHHQLLKVQPREYFRQNIGIMTALARQSRDPEEYWNRMAAHFMDEPLQLSF